MSKSIFRKKVVIFLLVFFIISFISLLGYSFLRVSFRVDKFNKIVNVNYKSKFNFKPGIVCYGNLFSCKKIKATYIGKVDTSKLGKYKVIYNYENNKKKYQLRQIVNVVDEEKPVLTIENDKALLCPNGKIDKIKYSANDNYDNDITDKIKVSYDKEKDKVIVSVSDSSNNKTVKELDVTKEDKIPPQIELNGIKERTILLGDLYNDEGAKVLDNCDDDIKLDVTNNVDFNTPGTYEIKYSAKDSSENESSISRIIHIKNPSDGSKIVYLTFDDGPSEYTNELLDILKRYNVKVTFFVTGRGDDNIIKREYDEGHKIALHTNTHDYSYVYSSVNNYFEDLYTIQNKVKNVTGYTSNLIRFPGGSSNTVSRSYDGGIGIMSILTNEVESRGFHYFDWNISSGDAGGTKSTDQVFTNVISNLKDKSSIVLQHDTQKFSINAVPRIIEYCQSNGYTFATLDETTYKAHHGVNN